jgi:hypothetical protein
MVAPGVVVMLGVTVMVVVMAGVTEMVVAMVGVAVMMVVEHCVAMMLGARCQHVLVAIALLMMIAAGLKHQKPANTTETTTLGS